MAQHVYIVELSDVQDSGLNGVVYQKYYCKSVKDTKFLIEGMVVTNKGFDATEIPLNDFDHADGYIRKMQYKWDNHQQGESNLHLPQRNVLTSVNVKKVRLQYT